MACVRFKLPGGIHIWVPENRAWSPPPGTINTGEVSWDCAPLTTDNLDSIITTDGLMVGNLVKAITNKLGIKQCLSCKGRQRKLNEKGLAVQRAIKNAILRS